VAKYLPNPANLALFKVVMAPYPGHKTDVTIFALDVAQAKNKVEELWGFPVLSTRAVAVKEPTPAPVKESKAALDLTYTYSVPHDVPLGLFTYCNAVPPTEEQAHTILLAFEEHVTRPVLLQNCMSGKKLLSDKPVDGVFAFIWQLARCMNKEEEHVPSTAFIDLIDGTSRLTHLRVDPGAVKTIMKFLESKAGELVDAIGGDRKASAQRWAQVEGIVK
jgi:hypothetical protein